MFLLLLLVCWPIAEVAVAIIVAGQIGVLLTILLLLITTPIGSWALRLEGALALRRFATAVSEGRRPGKEVLDGALVLIGGCLLIVPGFITDALGVLALAPPTRGLMRRLLARNLNSRLVAATTRFGQRRYDVDSTARDVDQPHLPR
jgi:UPF0716 protein FxsA